MKIHFISIKIYYLGTIPVQSEKVACDTIFQASVTVATFQFMQPFFVRGDRTFRGEGGSGGHTPRTPGKLLKIRL